MDYLDEAIAKAEMMGLQQVSGDMRRKGRPKTERRSQSLKELREHHQEILRLLVIGLKPEDIARRLDVHTQTVSNVRNSPVAQAKLRTLSMLRDDELMSAGESIMETAAAAAQNLKDAVVNKSIPVMIDGNIVNQPLKNKEILDASKDILDRAGHGKIQRVTGQVEHRHYTPDEIVTIREEALNLAKARQSEQYIDVEYEEVEDGTV